MRSADILLFLCAAGGVAWGAESADQSSSASWTSFSLQAASPWDLDKPWEDPIQHEWQPKHGNFQSPDIEIHVRAKPPTSYAKSVSYSKLAGYSKKPVHTVPPYVPHKPYEKPNYIKWGAIPSLAKEKLSPEEALWFPNDMPLELIRQHYKWGSQEFDDKFSKKAEEHFPKHFPSYESKPYEPRPVEFYKPKPIISYETKPAPPKTTLPRYEQTPLYYHEAPLSPNDKPSKEHQDEPTPPIEPDHSPLADPKPTIIYEPIPNPTLAHTMAPTSGPSPAPTPAPTLPPAPPPTTIPPSPPPTTVPVIVYETTELIKTSKESIASYISEAPGHYEPEPYAPYHQPYIPNPYPNQHSLYVPLESPRSYYLNGTPEPKKNTYKGPGKLIRNYHLNKDFKSDDVDKPEVPKSYLPPPSYPTYFQSGPYGPPDAPPVYDPRYSPYDPIGYQPEPLPVYPSRHGPPLSIRSYFLGTNKPTQPTTADDTTGVEDQLGDISKISSAYGHDVIEHQRSSRSKWPFLSKINNYQEVMTPIAMRRTLYSRPQNSGFENLRPTTTNKLIKPFSFSTQSSWFRDMYPTTTSQFRQTFLSDFF